jgi:hypothetical protein
MSKALPGTGTFKITVSNARPRKNSVQNDVDAIKASLLYGDSVTVISPLLTFLKKFDDMKNWEVSDILQFLSVVIEPNAETESILKRLKEAKSKSERLDRDDPNLVQLRQNLEPDFQRFRRIPLSKITDGSFAEIERAYASDLVTIRDTAPATDVDFVAKFYARNLSETDDKSKFEDPILSLIDTYIQEVTAELSLDDGYLLVDEMASQLIERLVNEGKVQVRGLERSRRKQASFAQHFLARLPSFPGASIDEILDIRKDLSASVIYFRSEMIALSEEFGNADDTELTLGDIDESWKMTIAPALQNIESRVEELKLPKQFRRNLATSSALPGLSIVVFGFMTGEPVADAGGAIAALAPVVLKSLSDRKDARRELETYPFYFLHETEDLLAKSV